jgi:uncharacterized protein
MHEPWILVVLALAGAGAGFLNTIAGAGSLLTLPALMLTGIPADVANATNRISVVAQSISGGVGFHRSGHLRWKGSRSVIALTLAGAGAGAWVAAEIPERPLRYVLLGTMIAVGIVMWRQPKIGASPAGAAPDSTTADPADPPELSRRSRLGTSAALLAAGFYGGFLQAGVGLVLLAIFGSLFRMDLVRANALKVVVIGIFSVAALGVFIARDLVVWAPGLTLAAGSVVGAQVAVRLAVAKGSGFVRTVVLAMVVISCAAVIARSGW